MNAAMGNRLGEAPASSVLTRDHVKTMKLKEKREPAAAPPPEPAKPRPGFQGLARRLFGRAEAVAQPKGGAGQA